MHTTRPIDRQLTAEKAIRESEERYRIILQSISDEVIIVDDRGIIETINDAVFARTYLPSFSVDVDVPLAVLFPEPFAKRRLEVIERVIREKRPIQIEERLMSGKEALWFSTKINPLFNIEGSCTKAVIVSRNITIEKEREEFLHNFSKSILSAQEDERKRVSRELHDGLAQRLAALRLDLRQIDRALTSLNTDRARDVMKTVVEEVTSLLDETRRIAHNLTPAILEDIGLTSAIQKVVREFSVRSEVTVQWDLMDLDGLFTQDEEIHIYRIIQEVISNIERHSHAGNVFFTIRESGQTIEFDIRDDGVGFDVKHAVATSASLGGHAGLRGLQERAKLVSGDLSISSVPGKGTAVSLIVPKSETRAPQ
ncbi:MAG TPA: sensor histidine kinase [Bacteroidota bacterium]|nr:sensor histidine kinase [Bacteroidota bacterium]